MGKCVEPEEIAELDEGLIKQRRIYANLQIIAIVALLLFFAAVSWNVFTGSWTLASIFDVGPLKIILCAIVSVVAVAVLAIIGMLSTEIDVADARTQTNESKTYAKLLKEKYGVEAASGASGKIDLCF